VVINGLVVSGLAQTTGAPAQTTAALPGYKIEETRLGPWDAYPLYPRNYALSSDGRHVGYIAIDGRSLIVDGQTQNLVVNGRPNSFSISSDGKHVAYGVGRAVMIDGHTDGNLYKVISQATISPDGKHWAYGAYGAVKGTWWTVVADGNTTQEAQSNFLHLGYNEINTILYSPDSKRLAYVGSKGKMTAVVDGNADPAYDEIRNLQFSADSKHLAYEARRDKFWSVVVDGHAGTGYEEVAGLKISSDGKHIAYTAKKSNSDQWLEIVEDWEFGEGGGHLTGTAEIGVAGAMFSQYIKKFNGLGVCTPRPNDICAYLTLGSTASFSPDGKRVAYLSVPAIPDKHEKSSFAVIADGQAGPRFNEVGPPVFSPDGKHMAYAAMTEAEKVTKSEYSANNWSIVLDGQPGPKYTFILDGSLVFNPDGTLEFLALKSISQSVGIFLTSPLYRVKYIPTP